MVMFLTAINGFTQMLEHQYSSSSGNCFKISDNEYIYCMFSGKKISIYSINHLLHNTINCSPSNASQYVYIDISRTLINNDSKFEISYLYQANSKWNFRIINEDGDILLDEPNATSANFKNTSQGAKLTLPSTTDNFVKVYGLSGTYYGKLDPGDEEFSLPAHYDPLTLVPEHIYPWVVGDCYRLDNNEYVYGTCNNYTNCSVYSLDHVLVKSVGLSPSTATSRRIHNLSRTLFNSDSKLEIVYIYLNGTAHALRVINEDGDILMDEYNAYYVKFIDTNAGVKMMTFSSGNFIKVYSLPGILYGKPANSGIEAIY
jgi:hypothetical protein